jgi:hypothetical protein
LKPLLYNKGNQISAWKNKSITIFLAFNRLLVFSESCFQLFNSQNIVLRILLLQKTIRSNFYDKIHFLDWVSSFYRVMWKLNLETIFIHENCLKRAVYIKNVSNEAFFSNRNLFRKCFWIIWTFQWQLGNYFLFVGFFWTFFVNNDVSFLWDNEFDKNNNNNYN